MDQYKETLPLSHPGQLQSKVVLTEKIYETQAVYIVMM